MLASSLAARIESYTVPRSWAVTYDAERDTFLALSLFNGGPVDPFAERSPVALAHRMLRCEQRVGGTVRSKLLAEALTSGNLSLTVSTLAPAGVGYPPSGPRRAEG
jgi:hypothetical protein